MGDKPRLLLMMLCACHASGGEGAPDGGDPDAAAASGTIEVGSADTGFVPLASGGTIAAYQGPQGGFHVFLSLRTQGLDPGVRSEGSRLCSEPGAWKNPCVSLDVFDLDADRQLDNYVALRLPLAPDDDVPGAFDLLPRQITMAITSLDQVDGHRFRVVATVEDAHGVRAAADLTVTCAAMR